jgi:hypothetical protein
MVTRGADGLRFPPTWIQITQHLPKLSLNTDNLANSCTLANRPNPTIRLVALPPVIATALVPAPAWVLDLKTSEALAPHSRGA